MSDFALGEEIEELRAAALRFAERDLAPHVRTAEADGRWPKETLAVLDGFSLSGLDLPESLGGVGAGSLAKVVVLEALATGDAGGLAAADQPGRALGALLACPDHDLATRIASAGMAREAQSTLLVVDDGEPRMQWAPAWPDLRWVWVNRGGELALVEIEAEPQAVQALAFHASGGMSVALDRGNELGRWDLNALDAIAVRGRARLWAAAVGVGVAQAALDATITYTTERVVFGKPVAHHQGNAFELAVGAARLAAGRLLTRDAARRFDGDDPHAGFWATQAWLDVMDVAHTVTDLGIQLLGGHGFIEDHLAEKRFREARMLASLHGGRDAANDDVAALALDVPDTIFASAP